MLIRNVTRGTVLASAAGRATTSAERRTGLLQHDALPPGHGLWISPCEAVHTFGMRFVIDVAFLSRDRRVLKVRHCMGKWRVALCWWAHSVLELPAGTLVETGTEVGDGLEFD